MNIEDITIGQAKQLATMFGSQVGTEQSFTPHLGKKCIIRTYASGVHFGTLVAQSGRQVEINGARRLWKWYAASGISLSEVAIFGIDSSKYRVCTVVPSMTITDVIEIIPCSDEAATSIDQSPVA